MEVVGSLPTSNFKYRKKFRRNQGLYPQRARRHRNRVFRDIGKQQQQDMAHWLTTRHTPVHSSATCPLLSFPPWPGSGYDASSIPSISFGAFPALLPPTTRDSWIHDSGASGHIINDFNAFFRYRSFENIGPVTTANGPVTPKGIVYIKIRLIRSNNSVNEVVLQDVLYMPTLPTNLYSGYQLERRKGWLKHGIMYEPGGSEICQVVHGSASLLLRVAYPRYITNIQDSSMHPSAFLSSSVPPHVFPAAIHEAPVTLELLHRRLGHISFPNVKETIKHSIGLSYTKHTADDELDVTRLCDPCEFAKPQKTIRRYPRDRELNYDDRIYTDVFFCSPTGYNKHNCGMIFTDGKTGAIWLYTFAEKGGAHDALVSFTRYFRTQNSFIPNATALTGVKSSGVRKSSPGASNLASSLNQLLLTSMSKGVRKNVPIVLFLIL